MSIIVKENGGFNREIELPRELGTVVKTMGIEKDMTKQEIITVLSHASIHMVAQGKHKEYQQLTRAVDEVNEWPVENVELIF